MRVIYLFLLTVWRKGSKHVQQFPEGRHSITFNQCIYEGTALISAMPVGALLIIFIEVDLNQSICVPLHMFLSLEPNLFPPVSIHLCLLNKLSKPQG